VSERRLRGIRVLVTRPRERAGELCFLLEDEGAEVVALPLLELLPPEDPRPLRAAGEHVRRYAWIAFASPSAVQAVADAVREAGTWEDFRRIKVATVGPRTAEVAREYGLSVEIEADVATGAGLAEALERAVRPGEELLLPVAEDGRREIFDALSSAGVRVTRVVAYRSVRAEVDAAAMAALFASPPDVALFGSPRTIEAFLELTGERGRAVLASARRVAIGPTTASALERLGLPPATVADRPTVEGLLEAAIAAVRG
jgi:uroporphyrinogen-III synthase